MTATPSGDIPEMTGWGEQYRRERSKSLIGVPAATNAVVATALNLASSAERTCVA